MNFASDDKVKINFTMWGMARGGGTRSIFEVSNRLVDRGHNVVFTSLGRYGDDKWFPLKAKVEYVDYPFLLRAFRKFVIRRFYRQWNYDAVLTLAQAIPDCDINVATFCFTVYPTVFSGKGTMFYYVQHYEPLFFSSRYEKMKAKATYFLPLKKLVVSKWLGKLINRMTGDSPLFVGNGVNAEMFYPRNERSRHSDKVIMSIFRGIRWKGEEEVIEAMNNLATKISKVKLLGVGSEQEFLKLTQGKTIKFEVDFVETPDDNKLAELYSSADLFVFASWYEGFGLPPLEAMACGTPVIATNCLGVREYAINGYNALLVPPRDSMQLSEAMARLLTDDKLAEKFMRNGLETAKQYNWDKVADGVENIFKSALERV